MATNPSSEGGPALSVVVCTRDRPDTLAETLAALERVLRPSDEAIVVDSASRDPRVRDVVAGTRARFLRLEQPGASKARNAGFAASRAPIVAFVDDDCSVTEGWADAVVEALDDDSLGFVTGAVLTDRVHSLPVSLVAGKEPMRFARNADPFSLGSGGNLAARRTALLAVGGWDQCLGPATPLRAAEDVDLLWRILDAGWSGAYEPSVAVVHRQWQSRRKAFGRYLGYGIGAGGFIGKVRRLDRASGRRILRARLWTDGILQAWRILRSGWKTGAIAELVGVVGVVFGIVSSRRLGIVGSLYEASGARNSAS